METAREFFESLPGRTRENDLGGLDATYLFRITDAGSWRVAISGGAVSVSEGDGSADVRITTDERTLLRVAAREQNPMTAYMTGKIKLDGDVGTALKLQKLFG
jgi:putative sterol carrier protein